MKLRKGLIVTGIVLALSVPTTAFAATSSTAFSVGMHGLFGINDSSLTTAQQADINSYAQKMADLQKSFLDTLVSDGAITQAQADTQKATIDSRLASGDILCEGFGRNGGRGGIDTSKLTDDQKSDLLSLEKERLTSRNDLAVLLVEQNLITQAQADTIKQNIDAAIAALNDTTSTQGMMKGYMAGFDVLRGVTLTDAQKTALLGWSTKYAEIEKKIVALYKDAGLITQAQADTMNTQIDTKASDPLSFIANGKGGRGMGKMNGGRMGGRR